MVVAALGRLVGTGVDRGGVFGQLQRHAQVVGLDVQPLLGLGQGGLGRLDLALHPGAFFAKGVARYVVALFGMEADQPLLLGLELVDQLALGAAHLLYGLCADGGQGFNGAGAVGDLLGGELDRPVLVVALDGLLDQLRADVGAHLASRAIDPGATEEVGVLAAVAAGADAEAEALSTRAAEDAALQVVAVDLWTLASGALLIEQGLHPVEGVLVDQRLMAAGEGLLLRGAALVDDPANVVGVAQDALEAGAVDLLRRPQLTRPGAQTQPEQLGL